MPPIFRLLWFRVILISWISSQGPIVTIEPNFYTVSGKYVSTSFKKKNSSGLRLSLFRMCDNYLIKYEEKNESMTRQVITYFRHFFVDFIFSEE